MNGKRLVATALAIALVAGAFIVRRSVIEDDDNGDANDSNGNDSSGQLVCITELKDVCQALETDFDVAIEDAGVTLDRLAALDDEEAAPLWLTVEPFPAMVDGIRSGRVGSPLYESTVIAASRLAVAFPADGRLDVLDERCDADGTTLWRCVGEHAGDRWSELGGEQSWGTLRPAFGDADNSALGLASFAASVAGFFGDTDTSTSRWTEAPFLSWVRRLANAVSGVPLSGGSALGTMRTRPSALDAAATASYEVNALGANAERYALNYPEPNMWLQVVLATPTGVAAPDDLATDVAALLLDNGWDEPAVATTPLPSASTMLALRQLWNEAA